MITKIPIASRILLIAVIVGCLAVYFIATGKILPAFLTLGGSVVLAALSPMGAVMISRAKKWRAAYNTDAPADAPPDVSC